MEKRVIVIDVKFQRTFIFVQRIRSVICGCIKKRTYEYFWWIDESFVKELCLMFDSWLRERFLKRVPFYWYDSDLQFQVNKSQTKWHQVFWLLWQGNTTFSLNPPALWLHNVCRSFAFSSHVGCLGKNISLTVTIL